MVSLRRRTARAAAVSGGAHLAFSAALAFACLRSLPDEALSADLDMLGQSAAAPRAPEWIDVDVDAPPAPDDGDGTRQMRTQAPRPQFGRDVAPPAIASGPGAGVPRREEWTGRADLQTLRRQLQNVTKGYVLERIRTARRRVSNEPIRQTPNPALATALSSRRGRGEGRSRGESGGEGPGDVAAIGADAHARLPGDATRRHRIDGDESVGFARPSLVAGPAATDAVATAAAARPSDDTTTRLRSEEPHPQPFEMTQAASLGTDVRSGGASVAPGVSTRTPGGTAAATAGQPSVPFGEELWLRTSDRRYVGYFQIVFRKVLAEWRFPRPLALELEQGEVVLSFTIQPDGQVGNITVKKSSGFPAFDEQAVLAVKRAAPLPPVPPALGAGALRVSAPFEYSNPLVR